MPKVMIRYRVKPDQVDLNRKLLKEFFAELEALHPDGLRYAVFQMEDGVSFVHMVETDQGPGPLPYLPAFQRYRRSVEQRCDEGPVMTYLDEVGSFRYR